MALRGMILAAGFGTRLAPLTGSMPKALVPVAGQPMMAYAVRALAAAGCETVVINAHHFRDQMREHLRTADYPCDVILIEEDEILGTGGGVLNAARYLDTGEPFLLHNADIVSEFDLRVILEQQQQHSDSIATLALNKRQTNRAVLFNPAMQFIGKEVWRNEGLIVPGNALRFGFCGIHAVNPAIFSLGLPVEFCDMFDIYRAAMRKGYFLTGREYAGFWFDLGTIEQIERFEALQDSAFPRRH